MEMIEGYDAPTQESTEESTSQNVDVRPVPKFIEDGMRAQYMENLLVAYAEEDPDISFQEWLVGCIMKTQDEMRALENEVAIQVDTLTGIDINRQQELDRLELETERLNNTVFNEKAKNLEHSETWKKIHDRKGHSIVLNIVPHGYEVTVLPTSATTPSRDAVVAAESGVYGTSVDWGFALHEVMELVRHLDAEQIKERHDR